MPLDASSLERLIIDIFRREVSQQYSDVVKGMEIETTQREDGTTSYEVVEIRGALEVRAHEMRPLARAIAQAVVQHFSQHAEVDDPVTPTNERWRIR